MIGDFNLGDVVRMKKPHPCGSSDWTIIRTGADVKLRCLGCGRIVMLDRSAFLKRAAKLLEQPGAGKGEA